MTIAIDLSLRSTGLVSVNDDTLELEAFEIVANPKLQAEELIIENCRAIRNFCENNYHAIIAIESLSLNAISSSKDILFGQFWYLRTQLYKLGMVKCVPVLRWRRKMFDKESHATFKTVKNGLKEMVVAALPSDITNQFNEYIITHGLKKSAIYDLADAYFLAVATIKYGEDW